MRAAAGPGSVLLTVVLSVVLIGFFGCGKKGAVRETVAIPAPAGPKVAIAPMENRSNDLDASEIIRGAFAEGMARRGWNVIPSLESDRILRESLGVSYGGQLNATTPEEVCRTLGVEGVFYGEVQEWNKTTTGIYNSVSVVAAFRLYRKDGSLAWEGTDRQYRKNVPRGGGREVGAEIVGHAIVNLLMNPMTPYGKTVGRNIADRLPWGGDIPPPDAPPVKTDAPATPPSAREAEPDIHSQPIHSGETGGDK